MAFKVNELNSARYTGTLVDETGAGFGAVTTFTLTLYDKNTGTIINGRDTQDVLNTNQVTLNAVSGAIVWNMLPLDNAVNNSGLTTEDHIALFIAKWSGVTRQMNHEVKITVANLAKLGA